MTKWFSTDTWTNTSFSSTVCSHWWLILKQLMNFIREINKMHS